MDNATSLVLVALVAGGPALLTFLENRRRDRNAEKIRAAAEARQDALAKSQALKVETVRQDLYHQGVSTRSALETIVAVAQETKASAVASAESVEKVHVAVNSERTKMLDEIRQLRAELLQAAQRQAISDEKATEKPQ